MVDNIFADNVAVEIMQQDEDLDQDLSTSVDREMIGQNGRKQFKQNWFHLKK